VAAVIGAAFCAIPAIAISAVGATRGMARAATAAGVSVAETTASAGVNIVEPPFKPPSTWGYEPKVLSVRVGTEVTWANTGAVVHTVTADDGKAFDSGNMPAKATFSFTPRSPTTVTYHCRQHPWMKGTLIVQP
jgi:plastocyanin